MWTAKGTCSGFIVEHNSPTLIGSRVQRFFDFFCGLTDVFLAGAFALGFADAAGFGTFDFSGNLAEPAALALSGAFAGAAGTGAAVAIALPFFAAGCSALPFFPDAAC